ncbi:hypothetical protein C3495_03865 [Clostridiaceae bacterium 14S0207]|nr:hypothetical protein C3495_03865 [Clostridiaceae bacterium 14S0207]
MSRHCCCRCKTRRPSMCCMPVMQEPVVQRKSCSSGCSFPCLIILILILLQFGGNRFFGGCGRNNCGSIDNNNCGCGGNNCDDESRSCNNNNRGCGFGIDSGILFIIALYYLSCCTPCAC